MLEFIGNKTKDPQEIIDILANRYIGANPCLPYGMREFNTSGFLQDENAFYDMDLDKKIDAKVGQRCVITGRLFCPHAMRTNAELISLSPCTVYLDAKPLLQTNNLLFLDLHEDDNILEIHTEKTKNGFGCRFKICNLLNVFMPDSEQGGFSYTFEEITYPKNIRCSDVYDFKVNKPTNVAWGRGNGWYLFSLAELLLIPAAEISNYSELVEIFKELAPAYKRLQGSHGLWHQVLSDATSFEETSCTAMFLYAFCIGVKLRILEDSAYRPCILKAYEGLIHNTIDCKGNLYSVCQGSLYSFDADYYKNELKTVENDNHGIGIVLLALKELKEYLNSSNN